MAAEHRDVTLSVPIYSPQRGLRTEFEQGSEIRVEIRDGGVVVEANKSGLRTLATQLLTLAQDDVPDFQHIHLDDGLGLEAGSTPFTVAQPTAAR